MYMDLGFHLFYGIFILEESFENRSTNHCYYWPCMEIPCLNRTLCSNGICSKPSVCLHRAAEGHKDKQWWESDSFTVNQESCLSWKTSTSSQELESRVEITDGTHAGVKILLPPFAFFFFFCQVCKCLLMEAE